MEIQGTLFEKKDIIFTPVEDEPSEVKVIRNRFLIAGAWVIEEIVKRTWIKPTAFDR